MNNYKVYVHINKENGKMYFGITGQDVYNRWLNGNGYKKDTYIRNAIDKHGWDNFYSLVLHENLSKQNSINLEKYYILINNSNDRKIGYNMTDGGECFSLNDEAKSKQIINMRKYYKNNKGCRSGENHPNYGKTMKSHVKEALINANKNKNFTLQHRKNLSENNYMKNNEHARKAQSKRTIGLNNPRSDKNIYTFINKNTLETFIGTRYDLCIKLNIPSSYITRLLSGEVKTMCKGWKLI